MSPTHSERESRIRPPPKRTRVTGAVTRVVAKLQGLANPD